MKTYEELIDIMIEDDKHEKQLLERRYEEKLEEKAQKKVDREKKNVQLEYIMNSIMRYNYRIEALRELKYMYYHQEEYEFEERV